MVNFAFALSSSALIGGAVLFFAIWAYEEYRRNNNNNNRQHSYRSSSSGGSTGRAPPQPGLTCSICQDPLVAPLEILPCGHIFHLKCIKKWFGYRVNCAVCRAPIPDNCKADYGRRLEMPL